MRFLKTYDRNRAVEYAKKWAFSRNPLFYDFSEIGGNCTNFVSQCVLAGSCVMNPTPTYGWYYYAPEDRSPSWTGVSFFYDFLTGKPEYQKQNGRIGPYGREVRRERIRQGDVVQLQNEDGVWYHSVLVSGFSEKEILVAAQSIDSFDRPLSTYRYANARFLHIDGIMEDTSVNGCFDFLNRGNSIPPVAENDGSGVDEKNKDFS